MSAYAHQMEQQYSARSLSDGSEVGSRYVMESGFYMSSYAATIFIAGLATVGILLMTLLVSLAVMLQSCQSKNAGVIDLQNINDGYSYCKVYALHAELNGLEGYNLPTICSDVAVNYVKGGQYARDLDSTKSLIVNYFNRVRPSDDGLDVVLMEIDAIFPLSPFSPNLIHRFHTYNISDCIEEAKYLKLMLILRIYKNFQAGGWSIILLSRELETHQNITTKHLISTGFNGWSSLIMRAEDEDSTKEYEYLSRQKIVIRRKGFRIRSVISSNMDALIVSDTGMQNFKLPDPLCDKLENQMESPDAAY